MAIDIFVCLCVNVTRTVSAVTIILYVLNEPLRRPCVESIVCRHFFIRIVLRVFRQERRGSWWTRFGWFWEAAAVDVVTVRSQRESRSEYTRAGTEPRQGGQIHDVLPERNKSVFLLIRSFSISPRFRLEELTRWVRWQHNNDIQLTQTHLPIFI